MLSYKKEKEYSSTGTCTYVLVRVNYYMSNLHLIINWREKARQFYDNLSLMYGADKDMFLGVDPWFFFTWNDKFLVAVRILIQAPHRFQYFPTDQSSTSCQQAYLFSKNESLKDMNQAPLAMQKGIFSLKGSFSY